MIAFIIERNAEIKEMFGYEIPFNELTQQSIIQYAHAQYGSDAVVRHMTNEEKVKFNFQAQDNWLGRESTSFGSSGWK
jgi:hypothetical protein